MIGSAFHASAIEKLSGRRVTPAVAENNKKVKSVFAIAFASPGCWMYVFIQLYSDETATAFEALPSLQHVKRKGIQVKIS